MDDKLKNVIVNLCLMKLPGEYIFTEIKAKNKDIRFTTEEALQRFSAIYSNIPTNAREKRIYENSQWYKIYSKYREKPVIFISNRNYLLMRDIYVCYTNVVYNGKFFAEMVFYRNFVYSVSTNCFNIDQHSNTY